MYLELSIDVILILHSKQLMWSFKNHLVDFLSQFCQNIMCTVELEMNLFDKARK